MSDNSEISDSGCLSNHKLSDMMLGDGVCDDKVRYENWKTNLLIQHHSYPVTCSRGKDLENVISMENIQVLVSIFLVMQSPKSFHCLLVSD